MAKIKRKEDKANCLSLGELCSSQLVPNVLMEPEISSPNNPDLPKTKISQQMPELQK